MCHLCGYRVIIWPIWGLGGAISLLYTCRPVYTWPSRGLHLQVFISPGLCLLLYKKLNFLTNFSWKDAILCKVSGPAGHNCPWRVMGFQVSPWGVFDQDSGFQGAGRAWPKATPSQMVNAWVRGAHRSVIGHIFGCCGRVDTFLSFLPFSGAGGCCPSAFFLPGPPRSPGQVFVDGWCAHLHDVFWTPNF